MKLETKPEVKQEVPTKRSEQQEDRLLTAEVAEQQIDDKASAVLRSYGSEQLLQAESSLGIDQSQAREYRSESGVDAQLAQNTDRVKTLQKSRRDFLKTLMVGGAATSLMGVGFVGGKSADTLIEKYRDYKADKGEKDIEEQLYDSKEAIREVTENVKYLREIFGIEVNIKGIEATAWSVVDKELKNPDAVMWAKMLHSFRTSVEAYPPSMFRRIAAMAPAKSIKLDLSLRSPQGKAAGQADRSRYRAPDLHINLPEEIQETVKMVAAISPTEGLPASFEREMDTTTNHELAHMFLEWPLSSRKIDSQKNESFPEVWNKKFGKWNESRYKGKVPPNEVDMPVEGFANGYGMTNQFEDRATVAEALFSGDYLALETKDPIIREKIQEMKRFYFLQSGGLMDEEYWQKCAKKKMLHPAPDQQWLKEKYKRMAGMNYEDYKKAVPNTKISHEDFIHSKLVLSASPL